MFIYVRSYRAANQVQEEPEEEELSEEEIELAELEELFHERSILFVHEHSRAGYFENTFYRAFCQSTNIIRNFRPFPNNIDFRDTNFMKLPDQPFDQGFFVYLNQAFWRFQIYRNHSHTIAGGQNNSIFGPVSLQETTIITIQYIPCAFQYLSDFPAFSP